jgi:TetR/AcrR family transcriptional regulator, transcriptional repressor for nem operon
MRLFFGLSLLPGYPAMRKGESTRKRIVAQAAPIFNQKGYAGTALSDLMKATGLEKGGIYRHFGSKQELAEGAFDYAWNTVTEARLAGLDEIPNAVDRLKRFVANFRDRRTTLVPGGCPLMNTAVEADDSNPHLRAKARKALDGWLSRLRLIISTGKRQGDVASRVDSANLATLIVSTLEGAVLLSRIRKSAEPIEIACAHLTSYLETNVRAKRRAAG